MTTSTNVQATTAQNVCMFCVQPTTRETSVLNTQIPVNGIYAASGAVAIAVVAVVAAGAVMSRKKTKKN